MIFISLEGFIINGDDLVIYIDSYIDIFMLNIDLWQIMLVVDFKTGYAAVS